MPVALPGTDRTRRSRSASIARISAERIKGDLMKKVFKVYGAEGHRQRESFNPSFYQKLSGNSEIHVINSDYTGTNEYSIAIVKASTEKECYHIFESQLSDGVFETSRVGRWEEITLPCSGYEI